LKLYYLGHSAVLIEGENIKALIDPFITKNPACTYDITEIKDITHIFITHGHSDHFGDTIEIAEKCNSTIVCSVEMGWYLSTFGLKIHPMHIGGKAYFDFGSVKMIPALHGSGIKTNSGIVYTGNPCGFLIELEGKKIYHAGDTGLTMEMQLLQKEKIDVAFIPIGGNYTMDIDDAALSVEFIKPKTVVPIHYNTFYMIHTDPIEFKNKVKNCNVEILSCRDIIDI